ncbi:WS/DGAT/MGAT family O-acyltransferase [Alkalimarinus sediminis]|uniref:diacylglycerol O-acyltransferase n=1 Tax=Alkalimarinus sediminis TaxID=1632866 RepID=A0A9E8HGS1_9ALTE|nr:wax ester/triacylglycerol synthase family O-acyltransferase [Alkalimarinus sediminis]UZW73907.1 wax ester/triacylglycerol synthase family O-acyltransferase [Alkalimarinus sediminis]
MQQLSDLDASFLYLETDNSPMLIGGLYVFDNAQRETPMNFGEFYSFIESRLHVARFFRQRLVEVPLKLDQPYWVDDPEFELSKHLSYVTLDGTNKDTQLTELAAELFSQSLDRDKPLWSITFVDGLGRDSNLPENCFAMIVRIHHAAIDALSGDEVMSSLLDFSATPVTTKKPSAWNPEPLPSKFRLIGGAYGNALGTPFRLANLAKETAASTFYSTLLQRLRSLNLPPALFSAPRTAFNKTISDKRALHYVEIPLDRIKNIRKQIDDSTINDVVMGICGEALHHYLKDHNATPDAPLIAMTPISVRSKSLQKKTGNQLSAMMLSLATDVSHPIARIKKIHENAVVSKTYSQAISAGRLTELIPSSVAALSARIYTEFQLAQRHKPLFNIPITNIPGPQTPLYMNGSKLIRQVGTAPLFDGIGVVLVVVSYDGQITISVTSCPTMMKNPGDFGSYLLKAVDNIEQALHTPYSHEEPTTDPAEQSQSLMQMGSGFIDDISGLFSNLFSHNPSTTNNQNGKTNNHNDKASNHSDKTNSHNKEGDE